MSDVGWALSGGVSHDAEVARHATSALAGDRQGVCGAGDLAVSQSGTPGMSVDVAAGFALVKGSTAVSQGMYAWRCAGETVAIAPGDPLNPRNDIVGVQVQEDFFDASGANRVRLLVVSGTPGAVPVDPSLPDSFLPLARVRVDANESTSIVNGDLTNLRVFAGDYGVLRRLHPVVSTVTGSAVSPASFATETTIATLNVNYPADGRIRLTGSLFLIKTAGDRHVVRVRVDGSSHASAVMLGLDQPQAVMTKTIDVTAGSHTIAMTLIRTDGSGNAQTFADFTSNFLQAEYVPAPP